MNPFLMQKDIPVISDLWKNEVNKYRLWIILFFAGILIIAALTLIYIILRATGITHDIIQQFMNSFNKNSKISNQITYDKAHLKYWSLMIIWPSIVFAFISLSIILATITIKTAYKHHNFGLISWAAILIIQMCAILALINIFYFWIGRGVTNVTTSSSNIFYIIVMFLYVPVLYFTNRVSRIRKLFLLSIRMEKLKSDPNYQNMQQQMQQFMNNAGNRSPFGFNPSNNSNNRSTSNPVNTNTPTTNKSKPLVKNTPQNGPVLSEADKQLSKLRIAQLREIAKKLYISGYDTMSKQELISSIKKATNK